MSNYDFLFVLLSYVKTIYFTKRIKLTESFFLNTNTYITV